MKKRSKGRCPSCAPAAGKSGGGARLDFGSNNFEEGLFGGADGYGYFMYEDTIPFRVLKSNDGFTGWMPKTKKIMGSIQQNFNPNDIDDEDDLDEEYQEILSQYRCHGTITDAGPCPDCGKNRPIIQYQYCSISLNIIQYHSVSVNVVFIIFIQNHSLTLTTGMMVWAPDWSGGQHTIPSGSGGDDDDEGDNDSGEILDDDDGENPYDVSNLSGKGTVTAAGKKSLGKFGQGSVVEARWDGGYFFKGKVAKINGDGTIHVKFDDGTEQNVAEEDVQVFNF